MGYDRAYAKEYRLQNRAKMAAYERDYHARNRVKVGARKREWYARNRLRLTAWKREWWRRNPEKYARSQAKQPIYENTRRARKRAAGGNGVSVREWRALLVEYGYRCAYCLSTGALALDHIEPLSKGGIHDISNAAPACKPCNSSKHDRSLVIWLAKRSKYPIALRKDGL